MRRHLDEHCCDGCWNAPDRPCPDLVECLVSGPLCHEHPEAKTARAAAVITLRREGCARPVIWVGTGTCGLGAGAAKTLSAIRKHLGARGIDAEVVEVGCIGLCSGEPLVDVALPGRPRVSFQKVTEEKVPSLLDAVWAGQVANPSMVGQFRQRGPSPGPGCPSSTSTPSSATRCAGS